MRKIVKPTKMSADRYLSTLPRMRGERQIAFKAKGLRTQFRRRIEPRTRAVMQFTRRRVPVNGHRTGVKLKNRLSPNSATNRPVGEEQAVPHTRRVCGEPASRLAAQTNTTNTSNQKVGLQKIPELLHARWVGSMIRKEPTRRLPRQRRL